MLWRGRWHLYVHTLICSMWQWIREFLKYNTIFKCMRHTKPRELDSYKNSAVLNSNINLIYYENTLDVVISRVKSNCVLYEG